MGYAINDFCDDTRRILRASGATRAALQQVKACMERLLKDRHFTAAHFNDVTQVGLRRIHADPELGFEIMSYRWIEPRKSPPHDHGDSWAIYGQVHEHTDMTEYERTDDGSKPEYATLAVKSKYKLEPGQAGIYWGHELHSTETPRGACYLRITGTDLENIPRIRIDTKTGRVITIHGRQTSRS